MVVPEEEQALVSRSRNGDPEAFATLVRAHQRMVHAVAYRMTGSLADAEDLAQETFVQAYRQLASFRNEARFSSWLYRVAMNTSLNWAKREARRRRAHRDWGVELDGEAAVNSGGDVRDDRGRVQEALLRLSPKQRAAVVLTIYDGLSHAEAARMLGCSETTVSWRLFMARARLKRLLKDLVTVEELRV